MAHNFRNSLPPIKESDSAGELLTIDPTADGLLDWEPPGSEVVYVREDPWIDPRNSLYGDYDLNAADNSACFQAAFTAWASSNNPNLLIPPGTTHFTAQATPPAGITKKLGKIAGLGKHCKLQYDGVASGIPFMLLVNPAHLLIEDFVIGGNGGSLSAGIESRINSATNTGGAATGLIFSNFGVGGVIPNNMVDGILFSKTAASNDANNDLASFYDVYGGTCTGSLVRFTHSQSKGHMFYNIKSGHCANTVSTLDNTGNGNAGGSFQVFGGQIGVNTGPVFLVSSPREAFFVAGVHCESVYKLFDNITGAITPMQIVILGCSAIGSAYTINPATLVSTPVDPPDDVIRHFCAGGLIVRGCYFDQRLADNSPAVNKSKIMLGLNPTFARLSADISFNVWKNPGTFEICDTLVNRQAGIGGGHTVQFNGNTASTAANIFTPTPNRSYGVASFLGTYTTAARPTNDLSDGDFIYDSTLDIPAWWRVSDTTWRNAAGVAV